MLFVKMHGLGNDYVYVDCTKENLENPSKIARRISDRHFGVGSDGLILIKPSDTADFTMEMYNADGSRGEMCGNGIRCVGKFVYDQGLTEKTELQVETLAGIKELKLFVEQGQVQSVRVDMGAPVLRAADVPVISQKEQVIAEPIHAGNAVYRMTCVSMGNPHAVVFVENVEDLNLEELGPQFEGNPCFPNRVNTEFIQVLDENRIRMRVWERGSGETLACGTGACAAVVASVLNGFTKDRVTVELLGGGLEIEWDRKRDTVFMTGPASTVFHGEIDVTKLEE